MRALRAPYLMAMIFCCFFLTACDEYDWVDPLIHDYTYSDLNTFTDITFAPDGKGYLTENVDGKKLLHLEGSPYEMGYQHGYLCGEGVSHMASYEFWGGIIISMANLDMTLDQLLAYVGGEQGVNYLVSLLYNVVEKSIRDKDIPEEFIEEMKGIVAGATDAGYPVDFKSVMMNNMAFDAILGLGYPVIAPFLPVASAYMTVPHACNAFVASGSATTDGRTLLGRDFMFGNGVYYKYGLLMEYVPDNGNRFVSVMAPSFVGTAAGMNDKGIGIGIDMVPALDCNVAEIGMGGLMINRYVLQHTSELSQGIDVITKKELGVSWLFPIADGLGAEQGGATVEVSARMKKVRWDNYKQPAWAVWIGLPAQIEMKEDLIVTTNHYLNPSMYATVSDAIPDSSWRYETLVELCLLAYGKIDQEVGRMLIDFLHPPNYGYYGSDPDHPVESSVSLFDLTSLELSSLYGLYSDPWVTYKFNL